MSSYYGKSYKSSVVSPVTVILCIIVVIALGVSIYRPFNKASDMREVVATVTDKAVKNSDNGSKYIIFTEDKEGNIETYEITDSWIAGRFDSSDVYAGIKVGNTYKFKIGGSRNQLMSWYPNIYEYELVE